MEKYFKYVTLGFFILTLGKGLSQSFQTLDVCVLGILTGMLAFQEYKSSEKREKVIAAKLLELEEKQKASDVAIVQLNSSISSIKLHTNKVFNARS